MWVLFFTYKQRLETCDVQNAVLVFSPTDDLNYPSPVTGLDFSRQTKSICPFSSARLSQLLIGPHRGDLHSR